MPKSASGLLPAPDRFWFRRRQIGRNQLPLVLQPGKPVAEADEEIYFRASGVSKLVTDGSGIASWDKRAAMWIVAHDQDLLLSVQALEDYESDEAKKRFGTLFKDAEVKSGQVAKRERGTDMHSFFVTASLGRPLPHTLAERYADLTQDFLRMISRFTVFGFERTVVCDELGIAGNLDVLGSPKVAMTPVGKRKRRIAPDVVPGDRIVVDNKTSEECDFMGEHALQLAPYANSVEYYEVEDPAIRARQREELSWDEFKGAKASRERVAEFVRTPHGARTDVALIVHAASSGSKPVHLHWLDLTEGYEAARHAMVTREWRKRLPDLCAPADPPDLLEILRTVETREEALALYALHKDNGWTDEHMAVCLQRWPRKAA
jgi:hypothetical protein